MNITDVRIRRIHEEGTLRAIVSVTFDDAFVVHDIKVIEGVNGLFVTMPSRKSAQGKFKDIAHPIKTEAREQIVKLIMDKYNSGEE